MKGKLKNNRVLLLLAVVLIVCFVLMGYALFKYFYSGNDNSKYGDRLDNIESNEIHKSLESEIKGLYAESEFDSVKIKVNGKIIYVTLNSKEIKSVSDAKSLALKSLEKFSDDEKKFYDIQYIITCTTEEQSSVETSLYPVMGYKNSTSSVVVWIEG